MGERVRRGGGVRVRIGRAAREEVAAVAAIERASFSDPWPEHAFREALARERTFFATACDEADGGRVLGYVVAWFVLDEGEIGNVAVDPAARGAGIGAALLDAAIMEARAQRVGVLHLEVRESNAVARALYASRGFEEVGRRRGYYRCPPEDAILLRRVEWRGSAGAEPVPR